MNTKTQKVRYHYCKLDQSYGNYSSESANDEGKLDHDELRRESSRGEDFDGARAAF
jgi:hypothetical protein